MEYRMRPKTRRHLETVRKHKTLAYVHILRNLVFPKTNDYMPYCTPPVYVCSILIK